MTLIFINRKKKKSNCCCCFSSGKENLPPTTVVTPRQSIDLSIDQPLLETDEERSIVQQRVPNTNTQAMNIILEEDEYSETPFIE